MLLTLGFVRACMRRFGSLRNVWCMRFETVNKTVKRPVKNGNKRGIARIAMEKMMRATAAAEAIAQLEEKNTTGVSPVSAATRDFIVSTLCASRGIF